MGSTRSWECFGYPCSNSFRFDIISRPLRRLRLTAGADKGGYYNERFLRGRIDLVASIQRCKVKGTGVRAKANPSEEPNLYLYPAVDRAAAKAVAEAVDVEMVTSSSEEKKVPASNKSDKKKKKMQQQLPPPPPPSMPFPGQILPLPTSMMTVPRDYDSVQDSLEFNAERLLEGEKQQQELGGAPARQYQSLLEQMAPSAPPAEREKSADINFDRLIDEMFRHDQSLDFADLLKLAAV